MVQYFFVVQELTNDCTFVTNVRRHAQKQIPNGPSVAMFNPLPFFVNNRLFFGIFF